MIGPAVVPGPGRPRGPPVMVGGIGPAGGAKSPAVGATAAYRPAAAGPRSSATRAGASRSGSGRAASPPTKR